MVVFDVLMVVLYLQIEKQLEMLQRFPVGSPEHNDILVALKAFNEIECIRANNDQANIGLQTK